MGSDVAVAASNLKSPIESVLGSKSSLPEKVFAMTVSGDARKMLVAGLLSSLPVKFRLKDVTIEFGVPLAGVSKILRTDGASFRI